MIQFHLLSLQTSKVKEITEDKKINNNNYNKSKYYMAEMKKVELDPVRLSIEPKTRLLVVEQDGNEIKLTRNQVNNLRKLREGAFEDNVFTSTIIPRNRFQMDANGGIVASCLNEISNDNVTIKRHRKKDDLQRIFDYVEKNKGRIAWDRDFKGRFI